MNNKIILIFLASCLLAGLALADGGKVMIPLSIDREEVTDGDRRIVNFGLHNYPSPRNILNLERDNPWALPKLSSISADAIDTIRVCAMRFEFVLETPDIDSTTGNGKFDYRDTLTFLNEEEHLIDPSPHNKKYFEAQLRALRNYWHHVSGGRLEIVYDVYPAGDQEAYQLPYNIKHYGAPNPYIGLTDYFLDCFHLVDTTDQTVVFGDYDSYFLFHAGADRQNDIFPDQYPPGGDSPYDLFTGYIFLIDTVLGLDKVYSGNVVIDSTEVMDALIMPETVSQDNRATALNAVMAHEFGHQLGLVDLYRTDNFFTRIGDFGLMDNNGFGAGIDFGYNVGRAFGVFPVYPMAWSRSYLGFDEPVTFRQGTNIEVAAAAIQTSNTRIAKIPISEHEYFLIENRQIDIDNQQPAAWADRTTGVILNPIVLPPPGIGYPNFDTTNTGEYDFLLPGSGMLIWKIDELAAILDYNGNGRTNFEDNMLQWDPDRPFIKLIEADGLVNFGAEYYAGYGSQEDMYYNPNNRSLTPNTNPPSIGHAGANTHIYITDISNSSVSMTFDLETDMLSDGFPRRAGIPLYGLPPVASDIDGDGLTDIAVVSGRNLMVINENGEDLTPLGPDYIDSLDIVKEIIEYKGDRAQYILPLFARTEQLITAGPVFGDFGQESTADYTAIGAGAWLHVYDITDQNADGLADELFDSVNVLWDIVWISFGDQLTVATMDTINSVINLSLIDNAGGNFPASSSIREDELFGGCRVNGNYALIAGDSSGITLYYTTGMNQDSLFSFDLEGYYNYGPIVADLDRDSKYEVIVATPDGNIKAVTIDDELPDRLILFGEYQSDDEIYANPTVADLDNNGYPEILFGGRNKVSAIDKDMVTLLNFPIMVDRAYPNEIVISSPIVSDIDNDGSQDIIVFSSNGNCYALNTLSSFVDASVYGFPINAGDVGMGTPVAFSKQNGGGLGFLGLDGWIYSYDIEYSAERADWPMGGGGPDGTYILANDKLGDVGQVTDILPNERFFAYPNPSLDGEINFYYELGAEAEIQLTVYDMTGQIVDEGTLPGDGARFDERWDLSHLPTGVYRCIMEANFVSGETESAFTDVAIIK